MKAKFNNLSYILTFSFLVVLAIYFVFSLNLLLFVISLAVLILSLFLPNKGENLQIDEITKVVEDVSLGKLSTRVSADIKDEKLLNLARLINDMLNQVEVLLREARYAISAVSDGENAKFQTIGELTSEFNK